MRIEDKIRDASVTPPARHQELLRARLLAHTKDHTMKTPTARRWMIPVAVGSVVVAGMIIGANLLQSGSQQTTTTITQKALEPLTATQVFAAAETVAERNSQLPDGKVYYQRLWMSLNTGYCHPYLEIQEIYTNKQGKLIKSVRSNTDGRVIESMKYDADGAPTNQHYFDQSAIDPYAREGEGQDECDTTIRPTDAELQAYAQHQQKVLAAYNLPETTTVDGYQKPTTPPYIEDLQSGNPKRQAQVLQKLKSTNEWKIQQNVDIPQYFKQKVTVVSFEAGPAISEKMYFSQKTKAYLGMSQIDPLSGPDEMAMIIVEQGVRPASSAD